MKRDERKTRSDNLLSRRKFLGGAAAAVAFTIVPRHVLGGSGHKPPSEKLNIAAVGVGGMGRMNLKKLTGGQSKFVNGEEQIVSFGDEENIVALCDVDEEYAGPVFELCPKAKKYRDYRRMLEKQKDFAVSKSLCRISDDLSHSTRLLPWPQAQCPDSHCDLRRRQP